MLNVSFSIARLAERTQFPATLSLSSFLYGVHADKYQSTSVTRILQTLDPPIAASNGPSV